ncbi:DUF3500 domain-containing protein [Actinokineospora auranticolor]|uniref:DUF3500 domain-containing protein n=1 Tax=Actinokineospora auranticolor TaxID=155976 RepID=UPI001C66405C|nr:DUF3500 domain-containing protein [Actinokineospora auranticolor]
MPAIGYQELVPKVRTGRRGRGVVVTTAGLAVAALVLTACGTDSSTGTTATTSSGARGPGGAGGGGGGQQTFTAVDLDTDGENASGANTAEVVTAVQSFLSTLSDEQKDTATFDFTDNVSRQTWSNFPASNVPRKGIALTDLSEASKSAAMAVVKTMLSAKGYAQVEAIQRADDWLQANSTSGNDSFGDGNYYVAVYGTPSATEPFMVQFGGHHLARNYTYKSGTASVTPAFTGTEPKAFTIDNTAVEPMKEKAGTAFAVFDSLTDAQDAKAKLSATVNDIMMGPGVDSGKFPTPEGLAVSELSADQKPLVRAAIAAWVEDAAPGEAASLLSTYESALEQTHLAYANNTSVDGESTYLRVDGPRVWIELVNTRSRSTPDVHYHGVLRDKNDDYGSSNPSS